MPNTPVEILAILLRIRRVSGLKSQPGNPLTCL